VAKYKGSISDAISVSLIINNELQTEQKKSIALNEGPISEFKRNKKNLEKISQARRAPADTS
jgi:hypothetical protein